MIDRAGQTWEGLMTLVRLRSLGLEQGDTVVTPKGVFVVLEANVEEVEVLWLETERKATVWLEDGVYGPVEVLKRGKTL